MAAPSILNVDDYLPGRYARTKLLQQAGFQVMEAGSGKEALESVFQRRPTLVLLDVNLPDMSGIEVCKKIRQNPDAAATTILHISASNVLTQHQVLGLDSGADGYIVEPVEPAVLIATVNAFLRARRAEDALRKSTEELRWFSYRVAHDLREPLRTITVYAELLACGHEGKHDPKTAQFLGFIGAAAGRMRSFIDGLLEYSQAANAESDITTFECGLMVARVIANLHAAIEESGARITYDCLPAVVGDIRLESFSKTCSVTRSSTGARESLRKSKSRRGKPEIIGFSRFKTMASVSSRNISTASLKSFAVYTARRCRGTGSASRFRGRSSRRTAVKSGSNLSPALGRPFISPCRTEPNQRQMAERRTTCLYSSGCLKAGKNNDEFR